MGIVDAKPLLLTFLTLLTDIGILILCKAGLVLQVSQHISHYQYSTSESSNDSSDHSWAEQWTEPGRCPIKSQLRIDRLFVDAFCPC